MPKARRIKYAPRYWPGVFPAIAILTVMVGVGAALYVTPSLYNLAIRGDAVSALTSIYGAESRYQTTNDRYASDIKSLQATGGGRLNLPSTINANIIAVCPNGWVAAAQGVFGGSIIYMTSEQSYPTGLESSKLPACVTAADLGKAAKTYSVTVSKVKVSRSVTVKKGSKVRYAAVGLTTDGAEGSPYEGVTVTWQATNSCAKGDKPIYRVRVNRQPLTGQTLSKASVAARTYTTAGQRLGIPTILNGLTYRFQVDAQCATNYPIGGTVAKTYTQPIPTSRGIKATWNGSKLFDLYGKVSSSNAVQYEIQARPGYGSGTWRTVKRDIAPSDVGALTFANYRPAYGDQLRVRGYTIDGKQVGPWSGAQTVRLIYGGYTGYSGYRG